MAADKRSGTAVALAGSHLVRAEGEVRRVPLALADVLGAASLAEATGYDVVFVPDHGIWEPFTLLATTAGQTERLGLGSGVVTLGSRTVETLASSARTLHRISGGRAILGVGSGSVRRIGDVRRALGSLREALGDEPVPLYLAALGPRMTQLAGEAADGVLLNWCPPERVAAATDEVARGADRAGRDPGAVTVAVYVRACLGHDDGHALPALREAAAMYAGIPAYRRQLEAHGLRAEAEEASRGEPPEALLRALCVWGGRDGAVERLGAWREAGADLVVVYPVTAQEPASSLLGTIMAAAPHPAVER